jgi:hypothetical protein
MLLLFALVPEDTHCPLEVLLLMFKAVHEGTRTLLALKEINAMDKTSRDQMLNEVSQPAPPGSQSGTFWNLAPLACELGTMFQ